MKAVIAAAAVLSACAPHTLRVEAEHVSHPLVGKPFGPRTEEDSLNQVSMLAGWERSGVYAEAGVGYNIRGRDGGGFYGTPLTGTVRVGYEWNLRK